MSPRHLREVRYDHPDAAQLTAEVQQEYVRRYGGPDETPVSDGEFRPPGGLFVVAYVDDAPVAMGGWRWLEPVAGADRRAELKRMYVTPTARGQGHARAVLSYLEQTAEAAGAAWLVLETGTKQPEAIALYLASGYRTVPAFGHYAADPLSIHLGKRLRH